MAEVEIKQENLVYGKSPLLTDNVMHYCPGCSHGTVHKLVAEVIGEMGMADRTIGVSPVGCAVFAYNYIDIDWIEAAHGRALAIASSPIRATATFRRSVRPRRSMPPHAARTWWRSTSTMPSTA